MTPADLAYASPREAHAPLGERGHSASIFGDGASLRTELREDAEAAGLVVRHCAALAALFECEPQALGEVVLIDCPQVDAASLAALARLDVRAARSGAQLVIATAIPALEDVFACCDLSAPQILVDPTRADRVVALGRAAVRASGSRLRELNPDDRLTLLRLSEQVDAIAERLGSFAAPHCGLMGDDKQYCLESPRRKFSGPIADEPQRLPPPLPDPRLVRRIIRQRHLRARFFDPALFADPAWDILLDLTAARAEHKRVSVTSLCIASGVPPTTALRWIGQLTAAGLLERIDDETDRRRTFLALSDSAADAMARYFATLGRGAAWAV
jgi:hypothetical protein